MGKGNTLTSNVSSAQTRNEVIADLYNVLGMVGTAQDACTFYAEFNSCDIVRSEEFANVRAVLISVHKSLLKGIDDIINLTSTNI